MIGNVACIHHLNRLMQMGIKRFTLGWDGPYSQLRQRVLELLVDQLHAAAKLTGLRCHIQGSLEAIENRQKRFDRVYHRVLAKVLLLLAGTFARVVELSRSE